MSREISRYTYQHGSRAAGCVVYDEHPRGGGSAIHVHHDTARTRGQHSAFDFVRLEKFGELDKDADPSTPVTQLPSYQAMVRWASSLPEIAAERAGSELEDLGELPGPEWLEAPAPAKVATPVSTSPFRAISAAEFAGGEFKEPEWMIEDHLPSRGIALAWGLSGSDKTGGVFDMLVQTHRGVAWRDKAVRQTVSCLVVAEGSYFFGNRMRAKARHLGIDVSELPYVIPSPVDLRDGKQVAELSIELLAAGIRHVWFDTLQQCTPGADENSVKDMGQVITNLKWLAHRIDGLAGVIHHAGKHVDKGARGSSAWRPAVDVEFYFESNGMHGTMSVEKLKDAPPYSVYPFERKIIELGTRANGKPITSVVVEQRDVALVTKTVKLPKPGTLARIALDTIKAAIAKANGPVDVETARAAVIATKIEPEPGKPDRRGSRAGREIEDLLAQQLLFRVDGKLTDTRIVTGGAAENF